MSYDDQERSERTLFSMPFRATAAEARRVYLRTFKTPEWSKWSSLDDRVKFGTFDPCSEAGRKLCEESTAAYAKMIELTDRAILAEGLE